MVGRWAYEEDENLVRSRNRMRDNADALCVSSGCPPIGPFHAVHMLRVDPRQTNAEKMVLAAVSDMNKAIVKAGCSECIYHLWRVSGTQNGRYNYLQISNWPGGAVYERIHSSASYRAASKEWLELRSVVQEEVYDRFEEIETATNTIAASHRPNSR